MQATTTTLVCPRPLRVSSGPTPLHHPRPTRHASTPSPRTRSGSIKLDGFDYSSQSHEDATEELWSILSGRIPPPSPSPNLVQQQQAFLIQSSPVSHNGASGSVRTPSRGSAASRTGRRRSSAGHGLPHHHHPGRATPPGSPQGWLYSPISRALTRNPLPRHSDYAAIALRLHELRVFSGATSVPLPPSSAPPVLPEGQDPDNKRQEEEEEVMITEEESIQK